VKYLRFPVLALLALAASQAHAIPVTYSMTGNGIYDNPVGTFTYDATTNVYTNVNIWSLDHYTSAIGDATDRLLDSTGVIGTRLRLVFSAPLTDAGGNLTFSGYERGILTMFGRLTRTGTVSSTGASVPEPSAALLLLLGLAGVWFAPRRLASKPR
jgi:hypothetical protein